MEGEERVGDPAGDPNRLEERVSRLETEVDAKIDDVRERVIQVKREADAKAGADHDHPDLRESAADVDDRMVAGFENFEEVLSYLRDATDENGVRLDATARAVLDLRTRVADLEAAAARREAAADIRAEANRRGVAAARCESCGASVSLGLLDRPACPDCGVTFDGVGPDPGLFRKPVLTAGEPPALAAVPAADSAETPADLFDRDGGAGDGSASDRDAASDHDHELDPDSVSDSDPVETPTDVLESDATGEGGERGN